MVFKKYVAWNKNQIICQKKPSRIQLRSAPLAKSSRFS